MEQKSSDESISDSDKHSTQSSSSDGQAAIRGPAAFPCLVVTEHQQLQGQQVTYGRREWLTLLKSATRADAPYLQLKASIRKGVPDELRPRIWFWLADLRRLERAGRANGLYAKLRSSRCKFEEQIALDVKRTFANEAFFQVPENKQRLQNILRAYANYDPQIGYVQGMNVVVAHLLQHLDVSRYEDLKRSFGRSDVDFEEKTFWLWVHICDSQNWRQLYMRGLGKLIELLKYVQKKVECELPEVHAHLQKHGINCTMLFEQVFLTLMTNHTPLHATKYIIDFFLLDGEEVIIDILMRMLRLCRHEILEKNTMETLFPFLKQDLIKHCFEQCADNLKLLSPMPQTEVVRDVALSTPQKL